MSYIEPKCLLKAKNWVQNVQNPSGEIWGLSFAATHSALMGLGPITIHYYIQKEC